MGTQASHLQCERHFLLGLAPLSQFQGFLSSSPPFPFLSCLLSPCVLPHCECTSALLFMPSPTTGITLIICCTFPFSLLPSRFTRPAHILLFLFSLRCTYLAQACACVSTSLYFIRPDVDHKQPRQGGDVCRNVFLFFSSTCKRKNISHRPENK